MRANAKQLALTAGLLAGASLLAPGLGLNAPALLISPAQALSGVATADDISIEAGAFTYTIKHIEATGTDLTDDQLEALFDDESKVPASERAAKLTAAAISIPEVVAEIEIGDITQTITYKDVKFANVAKGLASAVSVASVDLAVSGGKGGDISGSISHFTGRNVDMGAILHAYNDARTDDTEQAKVQYETISADGVKLKGAPDITFSIGKITGKDFASRALKTPLADMVGQIGELAGDDAKPEQMQSLAALYADLFRSLSIGAFEIRDLAFQGANDGKPVKVKMARAAMTGFGAGKLGEIAYDGLDLDSDEAKLKLAALSLRGFDFRPLLALADLYAAKGEAEVTAADPRDFTPTLDHAGFTGLDVDAAANDGQPGNAVHGTRNRFQVGGLNIDASGYIGGVPSAATATLDHAVVDLSEMKNEPDLQDFFALGYDKVDASAKLDMGWNEAAGELSIKTLSLALPGMGGLSASVTLGNVSKDIFASNTSLMTAAALGALLKKVEIGVVNEGILDKALIMEAAKEKQTPEAFRTMIVAGASVGITSALGDSPASRAIANAVAKFIAAPKNLKLLATSAKGLGAADLGLLDDPAALLEKIDVKATVNE